MGDDVRYARDLFTNTVMKKSLVILSGCLLLAFNTQLSAEGVPTVREEVFGTTKNGETVLRYTLRNSNGMIVRVMNWGAIVTEILAPDRHGRLENVILGSGAFEDYRNGFGGSAAVIGRVANRIAGARFELDGKEYRLAANNGPNHIHGGRKGFASVVWAGSIVAAPEGAVAVRFGYHSRDGEEGYPGNLNTTVTYTLDSTNRLTLSYQATTDKPTIVNLTNHAYFNLAGKGDVMDHEVLINASHYTKADRQLIPTGEIVSVKGTPLDFTEPMTIGARINDLKPGMSGYDHNYVINGGSEGLVFASRVKEPESGRVMSVHTTEPGVQLYTGNHLGHRALCLETQHYPDSIHHPDFPSVVLRPGQTFKSVTAFTFSTE